MEDKICCLCGNKEYVREISVERIITVGEGMHVNGVLYICENCLKNMDKCSKCHKYLKSPKLIEELKDWNSEIFCNCQTIPHENHQELTEEFNMDGIKVLFEFFWVCVCSVMFGFITESFIVGVGIAVFGVIFYLSQECGISLGNIFKNFPRQNYHILGYITVIYLLLITVISWENKIDYGYYEILRWLVTCFSGWTALRVYKTSPQSFWILVFSAIAILFNPVIKIAPDKEVWQITDLITAVIFCIYALRSYFKKKE